MLSRLDESLMHQASVPFRMAGVSDHRFFDRYWFEALDPAGGLALIAGLAFYKNMGQCDGFVSIQQDHKQHNLRLARPLGEELETRCGPLSIEVLEPFKRIRLRLDENPHGMAAELEYSSRFPPYAEAHHRVVAAARLTTDSTRYDQVGEWSGWIELAGKRHTVDRWWGARDHSWGVRPGVGGFEPQARSAGSLLFIWCCFSTRDYMCQFQLQEDGAGKRLYFDGQLDYPIAEGRPSVRAVDVTHDVHFVPGTRAFDRAKFALTLENGQVLDIEASPLVRGWAYLGTGYDGGYLDRLGLGGARGSVMEHDVYDLSHVETVLVDGKPHPAGHREQPARVIVNGEACLGHMPVMTFGAIQRYGLN